MERADYRQNQTRPTGQELEEERRVPNQAITAEETNVQMDEDGRRYVVYGVLKEHKGPTVEHKSDP
ncbi:hypothetical protein AOQ84DRAFT_376399 [Glonium stellatum]|uniref:Uncharacterized protein n=1 Tax=Glonium stellatum TaxID=574774 RepID=A0A8E2F1C6_9PEZI|nr:hypothetical protein AOQ84DRAFT_376399 [Glonium stellatum]